MKKQTNFLILVFIIISLSISTTMLILWHLMPSQRFATVLEKAQILKRIGKYSKALEEFQNSLVYETNVDVIYAQMAEIYTIKRDYQNASLSYEKAIKKNPTNIDYHFKKIKALIALGKIDQAQVEFERVYGLAPEDLETHKLQAKLLMLQGEKEKSLSLYQKTHTLYPNDINLTNQLATLLIKTKKPGEAKKILCQAIITHPENTNSRFLLHRIFFQNKEYKNAKKELISILKIQPNNISALISLGQIEILLGNYEQAKRYASLALRVNRRNIFARYIKADAYYHLKKFEKAIIQFELVSAKWPDSKDTFYKLATSYLMLNRRQQAISEYNKTLVLDPNFKESHLALAKLRAEQGWYEEVIFHCVKIIEQDPDHLETQRMLANAYLHEKRPEEAIAILEEVVRSDSHSVKETLNLVELYLAKGKIIKAIRLAKNELKQSPDNLELHNILGIAYYKFGDIPKAEKQIQQAIQIDPQHTASKMNLAGIYTSKGDKEKAISIYKQITRLNKNTPSGAKYKMAKLLLEKGEYQKTLREYKALVDQSPKNQFLLIIYASALIKANEIKKALEILSPLHEKNPNERNILYLLTIIHEKLGNFDSAINTSQTLLQLEPELMLIHRLAYLYLKKDKYKEMLTLYQKYLSDPRVKTDYKLSLHLEIGLLYLMMRDVKNATTYLQHALRLHNFLSKISWIQALLLDHKSDKALRFAHKNFRDNPVLDSELSSLIQYIKENQEFAPVILKTIVKATLYIQIKRTKEALSLYEKILEMTNNNVFILHMYTSLHNSLGNLEKQTEINQMIIQQDPNNIIALIHLGDFMAKSNNYQKSLYYYKLCTSLRPDLGWLHLKLGMAQEKLALTKEAIDSYQKSIECMPHSPIALNNLAWLYAEKRNDLATALEYALDAKQLAPQSAAISDTLGWIYLKSGRPEKALIELKYAIRKLSHNPSVRYHLALAYYKNGLFDDALLESELSLHIQNDFPESELAKALILELKKVSRQAVEKLD